MVGRVGLPVQVIDNLPGMAQRDDWAGVAAGDVAEDTVRVKRYQLQREAGVSGRWNKRGSPFGLLLEWRSPGTGVWR